MDGGGIMLHRETRVRPISAEDPDAATLDEAAEIIRSGGLVAFATETVYGLGADATSAAAVNRIFEVKERPDFNPLIVHVADRAMARACAADWPGVAETLAERYWPGPLTIVVPRASTIPDAVTAGRASVAIRVPATLVARAIIDRAGVPIAAPSANRSGGVSPTRASHVLEDLGGRIDLILDCGPTTLGLESTVVDLTTRTPRILRPGPISQHELEHVLGTVHVREAAFDDCDAHPASPGQLAVHYAPRTRAVRAAASAELDDFAWPAKCALIVVGPYDELPDLPATLRRFDLPTPEEASRDLYEVLRDCDRLTLDLIVVLPPPDRPEWHAVRDRLRRATRPMVSGHD